ncbi:MAG: molybdopterin dehydrogenase [Tenericutes bacterium HGW-Tenericutes-2]|jgi:CO/xanthine dehydrogenase FAD-binding subunit|nr:MAG: molybdopterin dehydrogenase [Tenericutes bacterium HGW-Tenericutes-2]PKM70449.1 MAG: molybdopterin dehydrogenase [Firmicutes bacterium HGW-Firmicutes-18]
MVKQVIPKSLNEAVDYLYDGSYRVIAGGTDLMVQKRNTAETPPQFGENLLFAFNLDELKHVNKNERCVRIGSMTSMESILHQNDVPSLLKEVIQDIGSPAIRNLATLAGNIGNASPAGDSLVPLYLLDAQIVLISKNQFRHLPIEKLILGPRKTGINNDEIIKEITIPIQDFTKTQWTKVGGRQADAISKVSFLGAVKIENEMIVDFRIAFGAVYKTVIRSRDIEKDYKNISVSELKERRIEISKRYEDLILPIDDQRSNKEYRKKVALNLLNDFIINL